MPEFKNSPYLICKPTKLQTQPSQKLILSQQSQFTIGRSHENTLQILDNTISKKHSKISYIKGNYYLYDLSSANGIYLNGAKIDNQSRLEDGDCIQFGKYQCLYQFVDSSSGSRNKSKGNGKINLKDYVFQDNLADNKNKNVSLLSNGQQSVMTQPINSKREIPIPTNTQPILNKKRVKPKQSKIRIPDLSDYLKLTDGEGQQISKNETKIQQGGAQTKHMRSRVNAGNAKQGKIKLQSLEDQVPTQQDLKQFRLQKRQRNIYVQQQQALQNIERQKRRMQQQKLKKQLQQAKIAEDLLQKQMILQQKVREQQQKVQRQKQQLQQQFIKRQQLKRQEEMAKIKNMQQKQRQMMAKIQQQRNRQLQDLKNKQQIIKQQSQSQYRKQYEKRKTQLQMQAQALAKQYQNIYRETIRKVRTQIDNEQSTIQTQQKKQKQLSLQSQALQSQIQAVQEQIKKYKNQFITISGRNKACILYASDIQDKIDAFGITEMKKNQEGYYVGGQAGQKSGAKKKIQDSVVNSRKLLKIKQREYQKNMEEILALSASIKQKQYGSSSDVSDFLDTITENYQLINKLKKQYLQLLQQQKTVQQIWEVQLSQNTDLQNKNRVLQNQITKNIQQIDENTRDQIKKSTQQRLHMLKIMYHCPQNKKDAARFLIQEMLTIQQQTYKFRSTNEELHRKITNMITKTEKLKRQNQYLSEILFSHDQNGHHFDNMKVVINNLMGKIQAERSYNNVGTCLDLANQGMKYQLLIQAEAQRKKNLKQKMRKICEMGLAPAQMKTSKKNPLTFFGDLLTNKQIEVEKKKNSIIRLQNDTNNLKSQIRLLEQKRSKISQALQKYKVQQISEARRYLGRQPSLINSK